MSQPGRDTTPVGGRPDNSTYAVINVGQAPENKPGQPPPQVLPQPPENKLGQEPQVLPVPQIPAAPQAPENKPGQTPAPPAAVAPTQPGRDINQGPAKEELPTGGRPEEGPTQNNTGENGRPLTGPAQNMPIIIIEEEQQPEPEPEPQQKKKRHYGLAALLIIGAIGIVAVSSRR